MFLARSPRWLLVAVASLSILTASTSAYAQKPPKGGGGGSTLPSVRYQIQFYSIPGMNLAINYRDTNSKLQTVGRAYTPAGINYAYYYDPAIDPAYAVVLNSVVSGIPDGCSIRAATAINEVGQISVIVEPVSSPGGLYQAGMVDMNQNPPRLFIVPDRNFTNYSAPGDINDWGDLSISYRNAVGTTGYYVYNFNPASGIIDPTDLGLESSVASHPFINNARQIVCRVSNEALRISWDGSTERFGDLEPWGITESGGFGGVARVSSSKRGGGSSESIYAFLVDASLEIRTDTEGALDLNDSFDYVSKNKLYHRQLGTFQIYDLIDKTDPDAALMSTNPYCFMIGSRDGVTNFPTLVGASLGTTPNRGFVLIPVPAP
jgi:hypothetical protein